MKHMGRSVWSLGSADVAWIEFYVGFLHHRSDRWPLIGNSRSIDRAKVVGALNTHLPRA